MAPAEISPPIVVRGPRDLQSCKRCSEQSRRKAVTQSHGVSAIPIAMLAGPPAIDRIGRTWWPFFFFSCGGRNHDVQTQTGGAHRLAVHDGFLGRQLQRQPDEPRRDARRPDRIGRPHRNDRRPRAIARRQHSRSEEHTSELQSLAYLVCRLLLEKKYTVSVAASLTRPSHDFHASS